VFPLYHVIKVQSPCCVFPHEGEHTIFGLLVQANLTQNDVLQFKGQNFEWNKNIWACIGASPVTLPLFFFFPGKNIGLCVAVTSVIFPKMSWCLGLSEF
jgi:hypothetical protein